MKSIFGALLTLSTLFALFTPVQGIAEGPSQIDFLYGEQPAFKTVWKSAFNGKPAPLNDSNLAQQFVSKPECEKPVVDLVQNIFRYRSLLRSSSSTTATVAQAGLSIQKKIETIVSKPGACQGDLVNAYIGSSVYLLTRSWNPKRDSNGTKIYPKTGAWTYFVIAALKHGIIQPLAQRALYGRSARVLGSYNCSTATISVDPVQRPLNLAATIIHEITHLFIDRVTSVEVPGVQSWESPFMQEFLIVEESVASLHAGYMQREFNVNVVAQNLKNSDFGDLTMYERGGPLEKVIKKTRNIKRNDAYGFSAFARTILFAEDQDGKLAENRDIQIFQSKLYNRVA
ncbi:MAG: hypothetical protein V4692_13080, partial [Bdellovibrionota bacterium]